MAGPVYKVDDAGNVFDVSSGTPVFVHGPQQQGGVGTVIPAKPKDPPKPEFVPGHPNMIYTPGGGVSTLPGVPETPEAHFTPLPKNDPRYRPEYPGAQINMATGQVDYGPKAEAGAAPDEKQKAISALQQQVDRVESLYRNNIQGGLPNPILGHLPFPSYGQFDSAAQGLVNPFQSAFRVQGQGSQSDTELKQFIEANTPEATDPDKVIEEKLRNLQTRIDNERGPTASAPLPPITAPNQDRATFATGDRRDVVDPTLKATGERVGSMLAKGVPDASIMRFLRDSGIDPANTNIGQALQFRKTDDFKKWLRANPGQAYPLGSEFYTKQVPMTGLRSTVNKAAASDLGGMAMAAGAGFTNSVMGDRLGSAVGALTGEPGTAETGMALLNANHPFASLAGDVGGQMALEGLGGAIPGVARLAASKWGRRGADALFGAYYGSGDGADDGLSGAGGGAVTNAAGGMFGRGLQRAGGDLMRGVKNANLSYLDKAGVPVTLGQIGHGSDSVFGNMIGGLEDRAAGVPVFDAIINSARRRGEEGFNRAAFREAGGSGLTGSKGIEELHNNVNNAYSFLDPVTLPVDAQFAGTNAMLRAQLPSLPKYGPEIGANMDTIDKSIIDGGMSGRDWQSGIRLLKGDKASLSGKEFSTQAADVLDGAENNLHDLALRQVPTDLQGDLVAANGLNKQFRTLTSALDNGPTQRRNELFSATRLDDASRAAQRKFGGQVSSMEGNRPFYQLSQAGMDVMPNQVPDSGTAGRALLYSALLGGGAGGIGAGIGAATSDEGQRGQGGLSGAKDGLLLSAALAAPYSKTGQKLIQKALLGDRPDRVEQIGQYLINKAKLGGMFGAGTARNYVYQPSLP